MTSSNPYRTSGIVAYDLCKGLQTINKNNVVQLLSKAYFKSTDNNVISYTPKYKHLYFKVMAKLNYNNCIRNVNVDKHLKNLEYSFQDYNQTVPLYSTKRILLKSKMKPDLIVLMFPQNFIMPVNILEMNKMSGVPILIYLMDMAYFTGGCHYAWSCRAYEASCGECPALSNSFPHDQSYKNIMIKHKCIQEADVNIIAPSEYLLQQARKSTVMQGKMIHKVLLPINSKIFKPYNKIEARMKLSLPEGKVLVLFGAVGFSRRKGSIELVETLHYLKEASDKDLKNKIHLAIVGRIEPEYTSRLPFTYSELGYLTYTELATAFQAADVFLSPSIEDSGPMMVNQAMMCGTPVVSFNIGVALDLVRNGQTGYTVPLYDSEALAGSILKIVSMSVTEMEVMRKQCFEITSKLCSIETVSIQIQKIATQMVLGNLK